MGDVDEVLQRIADGDIKDLLTEFRGEIERAHAETLQEKGWSAPPKIDEDRLVELNARSDELRKAKATAEVMKERVAVRKEIGEIIRDSGLKIKVDRQ